MGLLSYFIIGIIVMIVSSAVVLYDDPDADLLSTGLSSIIFAITWPLVFIILGFLGVCYVIGFLGRCIVYALMDIAEFFNQF